MYLRGTWQSHIVRFFAINSLPSLTALCSQGIDGRYIWLFVDAIIWRNKVQKIIPFVHLNMKDILNTDDLHLMVRDFYRKLFFDKSYKLHFYRCSENLIGRTFANFSYFLVANHF